LRSRARLQDTNDAGSVKFRCRIFARAGDLSASVLSEFLRVVLGLVLEEIDYEADRASHGAVAARMLAAMIKSADELTDMEKTE
jgi:hypothetical protein